MTTQTIRLDQLHRGIRRRLDWLQRSLRRKQPIQRESQVIGDVLKRLQAVPMDSEQYSWFANWIDSTLRLLEQAERGAARYQLVQLNRRFQRLFGEFR